MIGVGIGHFITISATCAAVFTGLVSACIKIYVFFLDHLSHINPFSNNDVADFVSYVLNFNFIGRFVALYYFTFVTIAISFILISVAEFVSHIYPLVVQFLRSQLNFISGDS